MSLVARMTQLIGAKQFDEVESVWMNEMESDPMRVGEFLESARLLRKADERTRADALLDLLGDALKGRGAWPQRLQVLKELGRLSKKPQNLRHAFEEALQKTFGDRPSFQKVMTHVKFAEAEANPVDKAEKAETWLTFDEGQYFFMSGRGAGVVVDLNPQLGVCRLDFEKEKRVSVPLGAAQKFLTPITEEHVLRQKFTDPDAIKLKAQKQPAEMLGDVLRSFGRPMLMSEVRDALIGIVPEEKWSSWWTAARKNQQLVTHGTGAKATYAWTSSAGAAQASIKTKFEKAKLSEKLELAKKHSARDQELADFFASTLAAEAAKVSKSEPALAWEVFASLERLPGKYEPSIDPDSLLSGPMASRVVTAIEDRQLREKAIKTIAEKHPDPGKVLAELFFLEEEPRVISVIEEQLVAKGTVAQRDRLIDETLRYPRRHVKAFYWYCKRLSETEELPKNAYTVLQLLLEALTHDEFASLRARLKEFFDKGGLAVRILMNAATEDQARKVVETLERYAPVEEYRRELIKGAALMKYPTLREPQAEPIYATAESLKEKREEFEKIKSVEIPANLKAIQEAREMGDLRENFEYKAARQRQEYLTARITALQAEMSRVRVLDVGEIDTSEVRVGTKIGLSNGDERREVTILGPWESSPEHGVYSNQADAAKALLGKHVGDLVSFMGNDYEIVSIGTWK